MEKTKTKNRNTKEDERRISDGTMAWHQIINITSTHLEFPSRPPSPVYHHPSTDQRLIWRRGMRIINIKNIQYTNIELILTLTPQQAQEQEQERTLEQEEKPDYLLACSTLAHSLTHSVIFTYSIIPTHINGSHQLCLERLLLLISVSKIGVNTSISIIILLRYQTINPSNQQ